MIDSREEEKLRQLVERIDPQSTLLRTWQLTGGVSAQVTAIEVEQPDGQTHKMIVRRHGEIDRAQNPHLARDEFKLLQIAQSRGLAAPKPYYCDESGALFPNPFIVIEYIEGDTEFVPSNLGDYVLQAAAQLAKIHGVGSSSELDFLARQGKGFGERPATLDYSLDEGRIRDALESISPLNQANGSTLLHGDFWPGNILWRDGELVAVIDWEDARVGDPLSDLANSRLEILFAFGIAAMHDFTRQYYESRTAIDFTNLPFMDLCAALRPCSKLSGWGLDESTENRMREGHRVFVAQALEKLPL
jgi:aminoglycoside phosphotransferase (APT) family kinase protein